jgi:hypothetical protein
MRARSGRCTAGRPPGSSPRRAEATSSAHSLSSTRRSRSLSRVQPGKPWWMATATVATCLACAKAADAQPVDAEALQATPPQAFGGGDIQPRLAVQQLPLLEQPVLDQPVEACVRPAATHAEPRHSVLGASRTQPADPVHDLRIPLGLHHTSMPNRRQPFWTVSTEPAPRPPQPEPPGRAREATSGRARRRQILDCAAGPISGGPASFGGSSSAHPRRFMVPQPAAGAFLGQPLASSLPLATRVATCRQTKEFSCPTLGRCNHRGEHQGASSCLARALSVNTRPKHTGPHATPFGAVSSSVIVR